MEKRREFVYQELIATEKDYIRDLECVVNVSVLYTTELNQSSRYLSSES